MPDLLIELFSEEIPARMQAKAADDLKRLMTDGLVEAGLTYPSAGAFHTPRRLVLAVEGLLAESPASREERKGPRTDAPEKALEGFLRSTGLTKDQLEPRDDKKGEVWFVVIDKPGRAAADVVAEVLEETIRKFPWPKSMRWGDGGLRWVRPLHSILAILTDEAGDAQVIALDLDGIKAGDTTEGHRFMAPDRFKVTSFDGYRSALAKAHVLLSAEDRADKIWHDATQMAFAQGLEVVEDKGLLAEVAGLVEWPVVLMGEIGADFLELPAEVLRTSMKEHQKFFSVLEKSGRIVKFVTVANRDTADHGATILAGNQKVLAARLADAKFFWENDLRVATTDITQWTDKLADVTFHNKLGSQQERIRRIAALAREIAPVVGADPDEAQTAALIAKADLSSEMVFEFPELQGVMGEYYAQRAELSDEIAAVAREHYQPLGPSDDAPTAPLSVAVALADKIDTLTGFWAIDEKPTGSKDPFALRRAALGVIRLVLENGVRIGLDKTMRSALLRHTKVPRFDSIDRIIGLLDSDEDDEIVALETREVLDGASNYILNFDGLSDRFVSEIPKIRSQAKTGSAKKKSKVALSRYMKSSETAAEFFDRLDQLFAMPLEDRLFEPFRDIAESMNFTANEVFRFFDDRLKVFLRDKGIRHDVIDACLAMPNADDLTLLVKRAEALQAFLATEEGENLTQGFKRAHNILKQAEEADGVEYSYGPELKLAESDVENALFAALDAAEAKIAPAMETEDFSTAMTAMATLRAPIDSFFEAVQVNAESQILRRNRLNLLHRISQTCLSVADLTQVDG